MLLIFLALCCVFGGVPVAHLFCFLCCVFGGGPCCSHFPFLCCVTFFLFVFILCRVCPMLPVSLDCPFLIVLFIIFSVCHIQSKIVMQTIM